MDVASVKGKVPNEILESLAARGIRKFTPPQELALSKGLLEGKNLLVASPTASGKTLIAELACVNSVLARGRKALYIAPMRALVSEKYSEFRAAYPYIKAAVSMGDMDASDQWLSDYEMVFISTEKLDSLMRHKADWLPGVGCIVFDEVHMLGEPERGPTLELVMTKLAASTSAQLIALSATIGNADELAEWLKAELVMSDYRPVPLRKGVVNEGIVYYAQDESEELAGSSAVPEVRVLEDTLERSKQLLLFYSSRRNAEAGAVRLAPHVQKLLKPHEVAALAKVSDGILNALDRPTAQCVKLAEQVKSGVAFHHAGLLNSQRAAIEKAFKDNLIKAICATPTLSLGVNIPAHTVLVRDLHRHSESGADRIGVNEVMQLFGRAGRPQYDKEGRALLIANSKYAIADLYNSYINAEAEPLDSNLGVAPVLRMHLLAFVAEDFLNDLESINSFMAKTFYGYQYGNNAHIKHVISEVIDDLETWKFIEKVGRGAYIATKIGKRISELYIDPLSAKWILNSLDKAEDTLGMLYMISNTVEMRPYVKPTDDSEAKFVMYRSMAKNGSLYEYAGMDYGSYDPLGAFSTAMMLNDWMEELGEDVLVKRYGTTPGALFLKLTNADWLAYSAIELAKASKRSAHALIDTRVRLRYGIKAELLDLVRLEQIGRVRARRLFDNGIRRVADINANRDKVARLLGKEIAEKVFSQLGDA
ncbi:MAG: DEAD/DEAH box helicase [Candidatus Marsarchaeota archaeon]|nr:DEAD/DEAH box helicase [Candidatus Marsarchaeota archaeon]